MYSILKEFITFLILRKKYYLIPLALLLLLFGIMIIAGSGSPATPFIYAIF